MTDTSRDKKWTDPQKARNGENLEPKVCLEAFTALTNGKKDFTWSNLFYSDESSLDGSVLRTSYKPSGDFGGEIYGAIKLWEDARWGGKGTGITFANRSSNPFSTTLEIRVESDPDLTQGPAAYRHSEHAIILYKEYLSKYSQSEQKGIIAHELGHAMGLEHGCKDTLMQGANTPPGVPTTNPYVPTGFDVFILQRVR